MTETPALNDAQRREVARIARATLREFLLSGHAPPGAPHAKPLLSPGAVYVTVRDKASGAVRAQMGSTQATLPLYRAIQEMTIAAATRDPRHAPLVAEDLPRLTVEVCVLGGEEVVTDPGAIDPVKDGALVTLGPRRGLVLPPAAPGARAEELLDAACARAGLVAGAWREPGAEVRRLSAIVCTEVEA